MPETHPVDAISQRMDLAGIADGLRAASSFLITAHINPDGDAVGSMLAMAHFLRALGKTDIVCVNDDPVPSIYAWLPGAQDVLSSDVKPADLAPDAVILLDAGKKARVGRAAEWFPPTAPLFVLDHHLEEHPDGVRCFVDPSYSATGEILVDLFLTANVPIDKAAAECLYVAIATDTGGFRFSNTKPRTHRYAALLLEAGIDAAQISSRVFEVMSPEKFELLRRVLDRMQREADGRLAYTYITARDMTEVCAKVEDLDGIVNFARNIMGVEVGILFRETDPQTTKVSIRASAPFNAAAFLAAYGGGGHKAAAGATVHAPLNTVRADIIERTIKLLGEGK